VSALALAAVTIAAFVPFAAPYAPLSEGGGGESTPAPSHVSLVRVLRRALGGGGAGQEEGAAADVCCAAALRALASLLREGVGAQAHPVTSAVACAYAAALCADVLCALSSSRAEVRRLAVGALLLLVELCPAQALGSLFPLLLPPLLGAHGRDEASDQLVLQALLHLGKKGAAEFRAAVGSLDGADRVRLQNALGGGRSQQPAGAVGGAAGGEAAKAEASKPKIALSMNFASFGGAKA